ncbi:hypothetical protein MPH_11613 [Macrophomina phaseolina MS6]|uniref:Uncharacterized protein n=1 Tax=Macrophomina phaseolina (strain MS6) TaxID=1126212 RepID=K2RM56_MACPH|nr:hypothetical protein MPH_11613 [Macrophomina phaseolina MS6]
MQSLWKRVAAVWLSVRHATSNLSFSPGVPPAWSPPMSSPAAKAPKSCFSCSSIVSTTESSGERMSRLKRTWPGMVLVDPGKSVKTPVDTRAEYLEAGRCECRMNLLARRRASARRDRGVVPVWASAVHPVSSCNRMFTHASTRNISCRVEPTSSLDIDSEPLVCLNAMDDSNLLLFSFKNGTLLDMELKVSTHWHIAIAGRRFSQVPSALKLRFQRRRTTANLT